MSWRLMSHAISRAVSYGWSRYGFVECPSLRQPTYKHWDINIRPACPVRQAERYAIVRDEVVVALISGLGRAVCPAAVLRRIRTVIVDSIDAVLDGWSLTHVGNECLEVIAPSIAHCDSTSTVGSKTMVRSVVTPSLYAGPYTIFDGLRCVVYEASAFERALSKKFSLKTSAGLSFAAPHISEHIRANGTTLANAFNVRFISAWLQVSAHCKAP